MRPSVTNDHDCGSILIHSVLFIYPPFDNLYFGLDPCENILIVQSVDWIEIKWLEFDYKSSVFLLTKNWSMTDERCLHEYD